jgi:hypothetical protein
VSGISASWLSLRKGPGRILEKKTKDEIDEISSFRPQSNL